MKLRTALLSIAALTVLVEAAPWVPVPRNDAHFKNRHEHLLNVTRAHANDEKVIFLGASSVEHWGTDGKEVWHKHYAPRNSYNYGIGGDRTEHVIWRIQQGELDHSKAKLIVLIVGFNNVNHGDKPEDIDKGIEAILKAIHAKLPQTKVLLLSILPSGHHNHQIHLTNKYLARHEDLKTVYFLDLTSHFEISPEHINEHLYIHDKIHLTAAGYQLWYEAMEPLFAKLISPVHSLPYIAQERVNEHHRERHQYLLNVTRAHSAEEKVVFLGASSIEHWLTDGKELWDKHYAPRKCFNYGISGDFTQHVLWRLEHGELDHVKAKLVVLIVGSNNVRHRDHTDDIAKGVHAIIKLLEKKIPGVKILLLSVLPRGNFNHHVHLLNAQISKFEDHKTVFYLDLVPHFESSPEHQNSKLFVPDRVHLTKEGYSVWFQAMEPLFAKLIA